MKGKTGKLDVMEFERHLEDNLFQVQAELSTKTYHHQGYHTFHVYDPKFRVINKACVRDRVVHHLLFQFLEPLFQPAFIYHSYSCQKDKGIHLSVKNAQNALRQASKNYTRTVWSLKMDIKKFFASVDHEILIRLLKRKVKDEGILWLIEEIVGSFGNGIGMPIGNLTSQIFANIYLSELDYFVKHRLGEHYYFRYADDFLFLHEDKEHLIELCQIIDEFVAQELRLTIHPDKIIFRMLDQGIDWLGYVLLPHHRVLRTKTKQRMFKNMLQKSGEYERGVIDNYGLSQSMQSYLGILTHCNGYRVGEQLRNEI